MPHATAKDISDMKGFIFIVLSCVSMFSFGQSTLDGLYIGVEEMCWTDSTGKKDCYLDFEKPEWKWYHLSYLKIKRDSVFLDQKPILIFGEDTLYSTSDGGFYYYSGTLSNIDTVLNMSLTEVFCDYCGEIVRKQKDRTVKRIKREKEFRGFARINQLILNEIQFIKVAKETDLDSEHPKAYLKGN